MLSISRIAEPLQPLVRAWQARSPAWRELQKSLRYLKRHAAHQTKLKVDKLTWEAACSRVRRLQALCQAELEELTRQYNAQVQRAAAAPRALPAPPPPPQMTPLQQGFAALGKAFESMMAKQDPPPQIVVNVPRQEPPHVTVNVPKGDPPIVNIEAPKPSVKRIVRDEAGKITGVVEV